VFLKEIYDLPEDKMEFFPLGSFILPDSEYDSLREYYRSKLGLKKDEILFVHTGKFNHKKKTHEVIINFKISHKRNQKLLLIGAFENELKFLLNEISSTENILYLGWLDSKEIEGYLAAADVYLQPGSQSATMQKAACLRCALVLYPYISHKFLFSDKEFYMINESKNNFIEMFSYFQEYKLAILMSDKSYSKAITLLDYSKISKKMYQ
jgi:hypothetical protein